jgi:hypothetical protein
LIIVRKDGRKIDVELKPFDDEEDLRRLLLSNPDLIPVGDLSEVDEGIIAWKTEFPVRVGSIDLVSMGDGGGIYLTETKLFKNQDKRTVIAQALDYAENLWHGYAANAAGFLEKLREKGHGEIPDDEEFQENITQNLRDANYNILIAMDKVTQQVKDLIEFLKKKTDFRVMALEVKRYVGDGLEVIIPQIYGEEISREPPTSEPSPWWSPEQLRDAFEDISEPNLKSRLLTILEWAEKKNLFDQSRGKVAQFGLKSAGGKVLSITADGNLYAYFGKIELGKYPSDANRREFVNDLKTLRLIPQDADPDKVTSGRNFTKKLQQLTEDEFKKLLELLQRHLSATAT